MAYSFRGIPQASLQRRRLSNNPTAVAINQRTQNVEAMTSKHGCLSFEVLQSPKGHDMVKKFEEPSPQEPLFCKVK
ncbi:hypothetical protein ACFX13_035186 [Malus domestica]